MARRPKQQQLDKPVEHVSLDEFDIPGIVDAWWKILGVRVSAENVAKSLEALKRLGHLKNGGVSVPAPVIEAMDIIKVKVDVDELAVVARRRRALHKNQKSRRQYTKDIKGAEPDISNDIIGLAAEYAFEKIYGYPFDRTDRIAGDPGYDFATPLGLIDTKGATTSGLLVVTHKPLNADYYLLAHFNPETNETWFIGWATQEDVRAAPQTPAQDPHRLNYNIPRYKLRPMAEFNVLLRAAEEGKIDGK